MGSSWTAHLDNGETVVGGPPGTWRELADRCQAQDISITSLLYEGEEVDPRAQWYFVIHDIVAVKGGSSDCRLGLGSVTKGGSRYRIQWKESNIPQRNYQESRKGVPSFYTELAIPVKREE